MLLEDKFMICESCCEHYQEVADDQDNRKEITNCCVCGTVRYLIENKGGNK